MTVKEKITEYLENGGGYISGEELAKAAGCTRGAVWKAVRALQAEGYAISAVTNRGYKLEQSGDAVSEGGIRAKLPENSVIKPEVHKVLGSTNDRAKELAAAGAPEGTLVVAGTQTAGKGRLGRSFYSPSDSGVYMSLVLRPNMPAGEAVLITAAAAVAVAKAVEELSGRRAGIKWVNDVYLDNKKICGILTEASMSLENGGMEYAVLGIGINAYEPEGGFPDEIKDKVGALFENREKDTRNALIARTADIFMKIYGRLGEREFVPEYRDRLMWKGRKIDLVSGSGSVPAVLIDADDNASLIVRYEDGSTGKVSSGEISIRIGE